MSLLWPDSIGTENRDRVYVTFNEQYFDIKKKVIASKWEIDLYYIQKENKRGEKVGGWTDTIKRSRGNVRPLWRYDFTYFLHIHEEHSWCGGYLAGSVAYLYDKGKRV